LIWSGAKLTIYLQQFLSGTVAYSRMLRLTDLYTHTHKETPTQITEEWNHRHSAVHWWRWY